MKSILKKKWVLIFSNKFFCFKKYVYIHDVEYMTEKTIPDWSRGTMHVFGFQHLWFHQLSCGIDIFPVHFLWNGECRKIVRKTVCCPGDKHKIQDEVICDNNRIGNRNDEKIFPRPTSFPPHKLVFCKSNNFLSLNL